MSEGEHDLAGALRTTRMLDGDHTKVQALVAAHASTAAAPRERAVKLYYAVRDQIRYDPYRVELSPAGLSASRTLENGYGWCVTKAVLLAAACRACGVPARVGFADVRNHLSTARLREAMGTDIFYYHGYTAILLDGAWVKATPAFNVELCRKMNIHTLEFDGSADSIYHPYDLAGRRHMEYVRFRGEFDDVPLADLMRDFAVYYPYLTRLDGASWEKDVASESKDYSSK